jgi:hypothetical protein
MDISPQKKAAEEEGSDIASPLTPQATATLAQTGATASNASSGSPPPQSSQEQQDAPASVIYTDPAEPTFETSQSQVPTDGPASGLSPQLLSAEESSTMAAASHPEHPAKRPRVEDQALTSEEEVSYPRQKGEATASNNNA